MSARTNGNGSTNSLHGVTPVQALREGTGELLTAAGVSAEALEAYARARHRRPALALELEQVLQVLAMDHPRLACVLADMAACDRAIERTEADLAGAFADGDRAGGTIRLDLPGLVAVTWPRPARRWVQRVKPERIAEMDPVLAKRLGIEQVASAPSRPIIKVAEPSGRPAGLPEPGRVLDGPDRLVAAVGGGREDPWLTVLASGELDPADEMMVPAGLMARR